MVDAVLLDLGGYFEGVFEGFWKVGEDLRHLAGGLEPLLHGVAHARGVVEALVGGEAYEAVVGLAVALVHEVRVVGGYDLDAQLAGYGYELGLDFALYLVGFVVGVGVGGLVALELDVEVVAEGFLPPGGGALGALVVAGAEELRELAADAGRRYYEAFAVCGERCLVGAGTGVEALSPGLRYEAYEVLVALHVLCEHHQVVAAVLGVAVVEVAGGEVHLAAYDGLHISRAGLGQSGLGGGDGVGVAGGLSLGESFLGVGYLFFYLAVVFLYSGAQLFDAEHIAVVGESHRAHSVVGGFLHHGGYGSQTVENGILRVNVQRYEILHNANCEEIVKYRRCERHFELQNYKKNAI